MRSKEAKRLLLQIAAITGLLAVMAGVTVQSGAAVWVIVCGMGCAAAAVEFCCCQAKQVDNLAEYLAYVYTGGEILDIRTQQEGELNALRDDIYKITTILAQQKRSLEQEKTRMADFLGDVAHQLRTPLSGILLQTELWQSPLVSSQDKSRCMEQIEQLTQRMQWLVEQLLKLCRLDAAVVQFQPRQCRVSDLLQTAVQTLEPAIKEKDVFVVWQENMEQSVWCDAAWTVEAITNLMKNGVEHTQNGGRLYLNCCYNSLYTDIKVCNQGNAIPPQEMCHLFERFWKSKDSGSNSVGIGLSLARAIAEGQGARLWAENEPAGPCFILRFYAK